MSFLKQLLLCIITSLYFYSFEIKFLPGVNTKMILAFFGGLVMLYHWILMRGMFVAKEFFIAVFIAILFSLSCYYSVVYLNNTEDYDYVTYIISMVVWYSGAYFMVSVIANVQRQISIPIVVKYLTIVSLSQCFIALIIEFVPPVKLFVDTYIINIGARMDEIDRLYGIGAELDVAGVKFACVLVMIAILLSESSTVKSSKLLSSFYIISFLIISIIGNMIARTTSIGMLIGIIYLTFRTGFWTGVFSYFNARLWLRITTIGGVLILFVVSLYNISSEFYTLMRFAFEGFFNWVETGSWETDSTEVLKDMWVFPDNLKTWIIGDGYFMDPNTGNYYMDTDVGYLRFIYYCGLVGLTVFCSYFIYLSFSMYSYYKKFSNLFLLLLVIVFANWIKVATDIFVVYAMFLAMISPYISNYYLVDAD